jgi:hypothetical protein
MSAERRGGVGTTREMVDVEARGCGGLPNFFDGWSASS